MNMNLGSVDLQFLSDFCGGDKDFMIEIVETFIETADDLVVKIEEAAEKKDWEALRQHAHQIAPSLKLMGMEGIVADFHRMQQIARDAADPKNEVPQIVLMLNQAYGQAHKELTAWLSQVKR